MRFPIKPSDKMDKVEQCRKKLNWESSVLLWDPSAIGCEIPMKRDLLVVS